MLSKDRDRAWSKAKETDRVEHWENARKLRNWANNSIKMAKATYVQGEITNNANDPMQFWRNIKEVLPDQSGGSINIQNPLKQETMPKNLQAQEINNFFANIGEKLATKFRNNVPKFVAVADEHHNGQDGLNINVITQIEVIKLIDTISMNKSSGMDNVSSRELTHLYNRILTTGIFPDKWKIAMVTPIPKVSNATSPTDLRPISLLPVPGKLIEKVYHHQNSKFSGGCRLFRRQPIRV